MDVSIQLSFQTKILCYFYFLDGEPNFNTASKAAYWPLNETVVMDILAPARNSRLYNSKKGKELLPSSQLDYKCLPRNSFARKLFLPSPISFRHHLPSKEFRPFLTYTTDNSKTTRREIRSDESQYWSLALQG